LKNLKGEAVTAEVNTHTVVLFECLVKEEHEVLRKAELGMEADSENYLGGFSETICTTSDLTFTRRRSATA
jgi:hypothetical protein